MAKFDPSNPEHVKAAEFMAAVEAEEIAKDLAAVERSHSGVDGPPMPYEEFLRLHNLPGGSPERL
jgi:hypothetical protein